MNADAKAIQIRLQGAWALYRDSLEQAGKDAIKLAIESLRKKGRNRLTAEMIFAALEELDIVIPTEASLWTCINLALNEIDAHTQFGPEGLAIVRFVDA